MITICRNVWCELSLQHTKVVLYRITIRGVQKTCAFVMMPIDARPIFIKCCIVRLGSVQLLIHFNGFTDMPTPAIIVPVTFAPRYTGCPIVEHAESMVVERSWLGAEDWFAEARLRSPVQVAIVHSDAERGVG